MTAQHCPSILNNSPTPLKIAPQWKYSKQQNFCRKTVYGIFCVGKFLKEFLDSRRNSRQKQPEPRLKTISVTSLFFKMSFYIHSICFVGKQLYAQCFLTYFSPKYTFSHIRYAKICSNKQKKRKQTDDCKIAEK